MIDGAFVEIEDEFTWWLRSYRLVENFDEIKDKNNVSN
jgi:DNA-directed RNA polymerase delta subunit